MGCVESRPDINDVHANVFQVSTLDDRGRRFRSARLEVTESHLVSHQRGRAPIRWPLRCLRRYGFDAEIFSFESGRRCPTGPGVYSYRCRRAEALFNLLQMQIQNIADEATSRDFPAVPTVPHTAEMRELSRVDSRVSAPLDPQGYLQPMPRSRTRTQTGNPVGGTNASAGSVLGASVTSAVHGVNESAGAVGGVTGPSSGVPGAVNCPASPPAPISPPATGIFYVNSNAVGETFPSRLDDREDARGPPTPGHDSFLRDSLSLPPPVSTNVSVNFVERTVSYRNHSDRPKSYTSSSLNCDNRQDFHVNHVDRPQPLSSRADRPLSYVNFNPSSTSYTLDNNDHCKHLYVNVVPELRRDPDHVYANLGLESEIPAIPPRYSLAVGTASSSTSSQDTKGNSDTYQSQHPINYITLDLDRGSDSSQAAPMSPVGSVASGPLEIPQRLVPEGYVTIDIDKTNALSNTAKAAAAWETEGCRRARHNSTSVALHPLGRNNNSLSE